MKFKKFTTKSELEQKIVQFLIKEHETDMETDSAKEKKREILDLFTNHKLSCYI